MQSVPYAPAVTRAKLLLVCTSGIHLLAKMEAMLRVCWFCQDTYILDAGLDAGIELPYTCRGGICGACVGRVAKGSVDMSDIADLDFTVNEEEQAQGMALLCMARPLEDVDIETQSDWGYSLGVAEWKGPTGEILGKEVQPLMGEIARG